MGCRYEWADDSHSIMNVYIEAPWTWEEYQALVKQLAPLVQGTGKPCATAVDVSQMGAIPRGNVLMNLTQAESMLPDNVFASAVVGAPYAVTVFMDILMRIRPRAKRLATFARTMPEAHEKIRAAQAKLSEPTNSQP